MKNACFISATREYCTKEKHIPAPLLRKTFVCHGVKKACLDICGLGFYELYLNGKNITKGLLAPYISNPDDLLYFDTYDITPYLIEGKNTIGVILGNGFQNSLGGEIWDFTKASFRSAPKLCLTADITLSDDTKQTVVSDSSFKTHPSPILFDDERIGEIYDAREELPGWTEPDFDDSAWENALEVAADKGKRVNTIAESIVKEREILPVSVTRSGDGYLFDFGENTAGIYKLCVNGKTGQKIDLYFGEVLVDGKFYQNNLVFNDDLSAAQHDVYICKGEKTETYSPRFTYHGFQYIFVTGITAEQAKKELLTYLVYHSDLKERGNFSSSDETANTIQKITRNSTLSNFYYFPTDCPHREKNGWTGDVALSAEQMMLNLDPDLSFADWMRNVVLTFKEGSAICGIVPTTGWGYNQGAAWDAMLVELPFLLARYRGNLSVARDSHSCLIRYLDYIEKQTKETGTAAYGLGDWCPVDRDFNEYICPLEVSCTATLMDSFQKLAVIFRLLGDAENEKRALAGFANCKQGFRKALLDKKTLTVKGNCQTAQAMALFYGVFESEEEEKAAAILVDLIHADGDYMNVGILGGRVIFRVLAKYGYTDLAFKMITRKDDFSYGKLVSIGATSLYEEFRKDGTKPSSLNHHMWSDVSAWFITCLCGICYNPGGDNPARLDIAPHFPTDLQNACAYHLCPKGRIESRWEKTDNTYTLSLVIPDGMMGEVFAPVGFTFADGAACKPLAGGSFTLVKKG